MVKLTARVGSLLLATHRQIRLCEIIAEREDGSLSCWARSSERLEEILRRGRREVVLRTGKVAVLFPVNAEKAGSSDWSLLVRLEEQATSRLVTRTKEVPPARSQIRRPKRCRRAAERRARRAPTTAHLRGVSSRVVLLFARRIWHSCDLRAERLGRTGLWVAVHFRNQPSRHEGRLKRFGSLVVGRLHRAGMVYRTMGAGRERFRKVQGRSRSVSKQHRNVSRRLVRSARV